MKAAIKIAWQYIAAYPMKGEVRGKGVMWGIELVKNQATREPFPASDNIGRRLKALSLEQGLTLCPGKTMADGVNGDDIMAEPPLNISDKDLRIVFDRLLDSLEALHEKPCD